MIIKALLADGAWALHQADSDVRYLGSGCRVEINDGAPGTVAAHNYAADPHLPSPDDPDGWHTVHTVFATQPLGDSDHVHSYRLCRWVAWRRDGADYLLVSDEPVFICNDQGDTIEALR